MNKLVGMFGEGTFNKVGVVAKAGLYLRYLRDQYRVHLKNEPNYERHPLIPQMEWKALVCDAQENVI